ncbi:hypothetical protein PV328_012297, partial [Microctonus aethiopoides]
MDNSQQLITSELDEDGMSITDDIEHYAETSSTKNMKTKKSSNKNKRKKTINNSDSDVEESYLVSELLRQIEELKKEIKNLKENQTSTNNNMSNKHSEKNEIEIIDTQMSDSQQIDDEDNDNWKGAKTDNFQIKRLSENLHIVKVEEYNDYKKTLDVLKNTKTHYFTYTPKQEKCKSFLLKGLDSSYEPKEVMDILNNMKIPNLMIKNVTRFTTPKSISQNRKGCPKQIEAMEKRTSSKLKTRKSIEQNTNENQMKQKVQQQTTPKTNEPRKSSYADKVKSRDVNDDEDNTKAKTVDILQLFQRTELALHQMQER